MSLTYERPSVCTLNGRSPSSPIAPTSEFSVPVATVTPIGGYTSAELAARTDVPHTVLPMLAASRSGGRQREPHEHCPEQCDEQQYTAIDVVRFAVLDRLMRSGVPVARAAALVQEAETLANTTV